MKKYTVTVGIPALNEEKNIGTSIRSILSQNRKNYLLEKVIVISDGSTDRTEEIVSGIAKETPLVTLIAKKNRAGQAARLNDLFKLSSSDIFITFDGDVNLSHKNVITEIVRKFSNAHVSLVGANPVPYPSVNFTQAVINCYDTFWRHVREQINNGHNIHNAPGCALGLRKNLYKKIFIPKNAVANDHYIFFRATEEGFQFRYAKAAVVNLRLPKTLSDYLKQTTRFISSRGNVEDLFPESYSQIYTIPLKVKIKAYLKTLVEFPVHMPLAICLQVIQRMVALKIYRNQVTTKWELITSSK